MIQIINENKNSFELLKVQLNINAFDKVRAETGVRNLSVLDELEKKKKNIDYNIFEEI